MQLETRICVVCKSVFKVLPKSNQITCNQHCTNQINKTTNRNFNPADRRWIKKEKE